MADNAPPKSHAERNRAKCAQPLPADRFPNEGCGWHVDVTGWLLIGTVGAALGAGAIANHRASAIVGENYRDASRVYANQANDARVAAHAADQAKRTTDVARTLAQIVDVVPRSLVVAEIINALPPGVTLTEMSVIDKIGPSAGTAATSAGSAEPAPSRRDADNGIPAASGCVRVVGLADDDQLITQFVDAMQNSAHFEDVRLVVSSPESMVAESSIQSIGKADVVGAKRSHRFELACGFARGESADTKAPLAEHFGAAKGSRP